MSPLASRASGQEYRGISPELMIAIVALIVIFLIIVVGFRLPANKKCCYYAPGSRCQCGPESWACQHAAAPHLRSPTRRGLALPVASIPRCTTCKNAHNTPSKASQVPRESLPSPAMPSSYYGRRAPTGVLIAQAWSGRSASSSSAPSSPVSPTMPPSPRLGYAARGPTATVRPVVW